MSGFHNIYCRSKDMTDFINLQGKLEHVTLTNQHVNTDMGQQSLTPKKAEVVRAFPVRIPKNHLIN